MHFKPSAADDFRKYCGKKKIAYCEKFQPWSQCFHFDPLLGHTFICRDLRRDTLSRLLQIDSLYAGKGLRNENQIEF